MGTRQEKKERITSQREEQILTAALAVFSRKGFGEATVPDIAQEAGIAVGTIYNYYQGKRDLLVSLISRYVITEPLVKLMEHPAEADDTAFLSSLIENRLNFGYENMDRYLFLLAEVQRDPELRQQYAEQVLSPALRLLERYLESRMSSGAFRPLNPGVVTRALGGMMIGLMLLYRIESERSPLQGIPRRQLAGELTDLVLNGLKRM